MCLSATLQSYLLTTLCLNPYYDGCASRLNENDSNGRTIAVLILIMMDVPLGYRSYQHRSSRTSLNPYYDGCASRLWIDNLMDEIKKVLILIMMDVPLGLSIKEQS